MRGVLLAIDWYAGVAACQAMTDLRSGDVFVSITLWIICLAAKATARKAQILH